MTTSITPYGTGAAPAPRRAPRIAFTHAARQQQAVARAWEEREAAHQIAVLRATLDAVTNTVVGELVDGVQQGIDDRSFRRTQARNDNIIDSIEAVNDRLEAETRARRLPPHLAARALELCMGGIEKEAAIQVGASAAHYQAVHAETTANALDVMREGRRS